VSTPVGPDSTVLVTGGTGSFGHTMVRRLLHSGVGEVRILSRDELKQHDMRNELDDERVRFYIGDVRDYDSVARATSTTSSTRLLSSRCRAASSSHSRP
jgi:UDP-N-acetylglucosamine 4,6-dehydratase